MSQTPASPKPTPSGQPTGQPAGSSRFRPPADPVLQQRAWAAVLMSLTGLVGLAGAGGNIRRGVYVVGVAIVIAAVALWLAATAMTRARLIGSCRPRGAVFATVTGTIGIVLGAIVLIGCTMFWPQLTRYSSCESGAGTISAQNACQQQFQNSVSSKIGLR